MALKAQSDRLKTNDKDRLSRADTGMPYRFLNFVNDEWGLGDTSATQSVPVLLTVSGGIDSVVLTHLCVQAELNVSLAHVNFGLRGEESDGDEAFVRSLAAKYGIPVHVTRFETAAEAARTGESVQMVARRLRYAWFHQLQQQHGFTYIATAHHQNDVLETTLLNLARGTGIAGLRGVPRQNGMIIRPLWFATRAEVENYAAQQGLVWREDSSNQDDKYLRNQIRHHVVPGLEATNADFWGTFQRTIDRLRASETILADELNRRWEWVTEYSPSGQIVINKAKLGTLLEPTFRLAEWLRPYGFVPDQIRQLMGCLASEPGQCFETATHQLWHQKESLLLVPKTELQTATQMWTSWPVGKVEIAGLGSLDFSAEEAGETCKFSADQRVACIDTDRIAGDIVVRPWQHGDVFRPIGMRGKKLVSDFLNEQKVPKPERAKVYVLLAGGVIVWVIGYRIADHVKLTPETRRCLTIRLLY